MTELDFHNISIMVVNGFKSGYYPTWNLTFTNIEYEYISENSLNHIAKQILNGIVFGEIIEDEKNADNNGWWEISYSVN